MTDFLAPFGRTALSVVAVGVRPAFWLAGSIYWPEI